MPFERRFGVSMTSIDTAAGWVDKCRTAEKLGFDVITVPDHLGAPSPFSALAVAATVTERVRLGPLVLNASFHNAALLARELATMDRLSDGRLEIGVGAGHMKSELDTAGIEWHGPTARIQHLDRTVRDLKLHLTSGVNPQPVQRPFPPFLIGGNSSEVLRIAAEHADIVGFAGLRHAPGHPPGTFQLDDADTLADTVKRFAEAAGHRDAAIERNMLIQHVEITNDRRAAGTALAAAIPHLELDIDELLDAPQVLIGTVDQISERIRALEARFGFTYFSVFDRHMNQFGEVVAELRGS